LFFSVIPGERERDPESIPQVARHSQQAQLH